MTDTQKLAEVAGIFTRLGFTAFGGPAAHIAMMRREFVEKRHFIEDEEFLSLVGVANLIPGPSSTELAILLGYRMAGPAGLVLGGVCFILPAMAIVTALAWLYARFHSLPQAEGLLYGMKPVVAAVILQALVGLAKSVLRTAGTVGVAAGVLALSVFGWIGELWLVFVPGVVYGALAARKDPDRKGRRRLIGVVCAVGVLVVGALGFSAYAVAGGAFSLSALFIVFVKTGAVLYGSGYVLLSYLNTDLVLRLGWLTKAQLLDAVAVGQFTPGPVFTTATFVGFLLGGFPGAIVATVAIFLPSFLLVGSAAKLSRKLQESAATQAFLKGVNAASLGLMGAVLVKLGRAAIVDWLTLAIAVVSFAVLMRTKWNSAWLVGAGALIGLAVCGRA